MTKMQLEPEFRSKWLEALRSPDNEGREVYARLTDFHGQFCALGLAAHANAKPLVTEDDEAYAYDWLEEKGVDTRQVWFTFDPDETMTFKQFADWLEANSEPAA